MAGDRKQFKEALDKWDSLHEAESFSVPLAVGNTAIISSAFTDDEPTTPAGANELIAFRAEALDLEQRVHMEGGKPVVSIDASHDDIDAIIQDPKITSLYIIGNGILSAVLLDVDRRYDWADASRATDHLKTGFFEQRQCGGLPRSANVPLGLFVMSSHSQVRAA